MHRSSILELPKGEISLKKLNFIFNLDKTHNLRGHRNHEEFPAASMVNAILLSSTNSGTSGGHCSTRPAIPLPLLMHPITIQHKPIWARPRRLIKLHLRKERTALDRRHTVRGESREIP